MSAQATAVLLGLLLSLTNFAIFIVMAIWALPRRTTTASAILIAGIVVRLTIVFVVFTLLALSSTWQLLLWWVTAGFVPSSIGLIAVEIALVVRMEKNLPKTPKSRLEKASQCE